METTTTTVRQEARRIFPDLCLLLGLVLAGALTAGPGPAVAGELRVTLDGEAGVRSDGNYGQVAQTGLTEEEIENQELARAGLNLLLSWTQQERFQIALGYSPSYERSLDDDELTGTAHRLDLALRGDLTRRLWVQARERLLSSPNLDLYQPVIAGEPVAVPRRGDQLLHSFDVSLNHDISRRFAWFAGAAHGRRSFEDEALFDTDTLEGRLGASWRWTEEQVFEATAGAGLFTYENDRETDVRTLGLAYQHPIGRDTLLRVEAGSFWVEASNPGRPRVIDPVDPTDPDAEPLPPIVETVVDEESKTGWRGGVRLTQERRLFNWNVGYRHDVAPGYGLGRESEVDAAFLGISTNIGRRLLLGLDGNASRQQEIVGSLGGSDGAEERDLEFAAGTARLSWTILPALRLSGGYSRIWQSSKVEPFDNLSYDRFFLGLNVRLFSTGETPRSPGELQRPEEPEELEEEIEDNEQPDAQ
jgi:hypothetical protein